MISYSLWIMEIFSLSVFTILTRT